MSVATTADWLDSVRRHSGNKPNAHDWPEEWPHENGAYGCECMHCGAAFIGHKRRVVCKQCAEKPGPPTGEQK